MKKNFNIICIASILLITAFIYKDSFSGFFFQDDWFSFYISKVSSLGNFVSLFIPRTDVIYYRPLGMQVPFFLMRTLFGLNPFPYHLVIFLMHSLNIILAYRLLKLLTHKTEVGLIGAFFYGTSSVHFIPFYWFATFAFVLGPTFFLSSFFCFINAKLWDKSYKNSLILFTLGLFTFEMIVVLPLLLLCYVLIFDKNKFRHVIPFFICGGLFFGLRFLFFRPPTEGSYHIEIGTQIIQNLKIYILWSTNWSESITEQLKKLFIFQDEFFQGFYFVSLSTLVTFFIHWGTIIISVLFGIIFSKEKTLKFTQLGILWFLIGLLPVIFFPAHRFAYYLPLSLVGLSIIFSQAIFIWKKRFPTMFLLVLCILCFNWILSSYVTNQFNLLAHWAPRRSTLARVEIEKIKVRLSRSEVLPEIFYISGSREIQHALNDQTALRVFFNNPNITTLYRK